MNMNISWLAERLANRVGVRRVRPWWATVLPAVVLGTIGLGPGIGPAIANGAGLASTSSRRT